MELPLVSVDETQLKMLLMVRWVSPPAIGVEALSQMMVAQRDGRLVIAQMVQYARM